MTEDGAFSRGVGFAMTGVWAEGAGSASTKPYWQVEAWTQRIGMCRID